MGLSRVGDLLCFVAQKGHNNHIVRFQVRKGEIPVHAGCDSVRTVLDRHGGTNYRALFISYNTTDTLPSGLCRPWESRQYIQSGKSENCHATSE